MENLIKRLEATELTIATLGDSIERMGERLKELPDNAAKMELIRRWRTMASELADVAIAADETIWELN